MCVRVRVRVCVCRVVPPILTYQSINLSIFFFLYFFLFLLFSLSLLNYILLCDHQVSFFFATILLFFLLSFIFSIIIFCDKKIPFS
ncbi:hypothetical protein J3Q64DRAFT_1726541 [Phycomyces blakesleeanus]|uniref:Uncharacterized protein n=1 Tax=Phycomyces blakesleeanus TaxID=4837 RepID=A0ABR3B8M4_PHYBL